MVVRSLEVNKDSFRPKEENEELFGLEVPYLSAIGALIYLANCTRPDIAFSVNLLARYNSAPTKRHWNEDIFQILIKLDLKRDMSLLMVE
ncbi:hypothetical protein CK203_050971 [Vitis vinifera]|uniref:Retrovirus-related Pol polyprotein from transposon TNT 1-94 n=1 Tax=Vitis vinifera TaxID=29760 RepID=A0A438H2V7_VITVI|nr:hypothetical protein CK203_050971 [Vitis vinifera]